MQIRSIQYWCCKYQCDLTHSNFWFLGFKNRVGHRVDISVLVSTVDEPTSFKVARANMNYRTVPTFLIVAALGPTQSSSYFLVGMRRKVALLTHLTAWQEAVVMPFTAVFRHIFPTCKETAYCPGIKVSRSIYCLGFQLCSPFGVDYSD